MFRYEHSNNRHGHTALYFMGPCLSFARCSPWPHGCPSVVASFILSTAPTSYLVLESWNAVPSGPDHLVADAHWLTAAYRARMCSKK